MAAQIADNESIRNYIDRRWHRARRFPTMTMSFRTEGVQCYVFQRKMNIDRRSKMRKRMLASLFVHQGGCCFYCNRAMRYTTCEGGIEVYSSPHVGFTVDHFFPKSFGFSTHCNTVLSCRFCNEHKGNRMPTVGEILKAIDLYERMDIPFIAKMG